MADLYPREDLGGQVRLGRDITVSGLAMMNTSGPLDSCSTARWTRVPRQAVEVNAAAAHLRVRLINMRGGGGSW
ncbi:MAG TPA: hypothetical protein VMV92_29705 [Streptosporangiaceae bacterium]|nr:hypothetical protein [Streptosporangiaceae bacterium]